jgi:ABC-type iron transport system FetAB ATPase subunit
MSGHVNNAQTNRALIQDLLDEVERSMKNLEREILDLSGDEG